MSGTAGNLPAGGGANAPAGNANAPAGNANVPAGNANAPAGNVVQQGAAGNAVQQGAPASGVAAGGANPNQLQLVPLQRGGVVQFGTHQVPWTSGSPGVLQEPVSHSVFCSQDSLKDAMKARRHAKSRSVRCNA